ncbi:MarR family transcriptional regulator [Olivibacter domesticus]|uniref:Winged helix DNA-binding domain-containing protein n=1 Tax=Olivibacter domesticus TaxID=407022 RepID=A0A1H7UCZ1_OLID1|nr:helix-turn-helix domain-containing protein [Olivibacter domesticus]SEL94821.1 Winged helix DNA-binding domain-containing protein [Olivibacter domesticus]
MKPIIELITEWDIFSSRREDANVEDFCTYYLAKKKKEEKQVVFKGMAPPDLDTTLAKLIGRISVMQIIYSRMALKETDGIELEWFYFLNAIYHLQEANKTDIISFHLMEHSTGVDILNRIKKAGYISEREDPTDKRAKLLKLTADGEKLLLQLYELLYKPTFLLFYEIPTVEKQLIINLLSATEIKHGQILSKGRNKNLDELIEAGIGKEKMEEAFQELKKRIDTFKQRRY